MQERKELGRISKVVFGHGGYQDCMIGLSLTLECKGWGVDTFVDGFWDPSIMKRSEHAQWTEAGRTAAQASLVVKISELLKQAKIHDVMQLLNIPVECTFEGMMLKDWRILEEVL